MTAEKFDAVFTDTYERCRELLIAKAKEYAADGDRLHNFRIAARLMGVTPLGALAGMMCKHTVSVYDLAGAYEKGQVAALALWDEKIIDSINYLILLRALIYEEYGLTPCGKAAAEEV